MLVPEKIEFIVLIRSFQFEKALMQEHFNENYMESAKYPKATFSGNLPICPIFNLTKMEHIRLPFPVS
jgi:uncharacterized protein YcsI (UPF0317 family)